MFFFRINKYSSLQIFLAVLNFDLFVIGIKCRYLSARKCAQMPGQNSSETLKFEKVIGRAYEAPI